ncbi:MAG: universal stress protein [Candidatus Limnocylindrales bacterium]
MKRILVAYDGEPPARRALDTAAEIARGHDAAITVVSVVPFRLGRDPDEAWQDQADHSVVLEEAVKILAEQGIAATMLEPWGDPAAMIERVAEEGDYDTIIVGSRSLGAVARLLKGSVSEHVATHADATVVIAR